MRHDTPLSPAVIVLESSSPTGVKTENLPKSIAIVGNALLELTLICLFRGQEQKCQPQTYCTGKNNQ
jgi:hypothetical protein